VLSIRDGVFIRTFLTEGCRADRQQTNKCAVRRVVIRDRRDADDDDADDVKKIVIIDIERIVKVLLKHKVTCSQGPPREEGLGGWGGRHEPVQNDDYDDNNNNGHEVAEKVTMAGRQSYV